MVSKDVIDDDYEDYLMFEVDLSKVFSETIETQNGHKVLTETLSFKIQNTIGRDSLRVRGVLPLNPPGQITIDNWFRTTTEYQVVKGNGDCKMSDSSTWKEINVDR